MARAREVQNAAGEKTEDEGHEDEGAGQPERADQDVGQACRISRRLDELDDDRRW
jgi:hypothetical protein